MKIAKPVNSVKIWKFGDPIVTGAFKRFPSEFAWSEICTFDFSVEETALGVRISIPLDETSPVVGLGQHVGPVNCRGQVFRLFSTDNHIHIPSLRSMYGTYPLLFVLSDRPHAFFIDSPSDIKVDVGSTDRTKLILKIYSKDFHFTKIEGDSVASIFSKYIDLVGPPVVPPRWAFGYQQSRWSYKNEDEVRELVSKFSEHSIPLDVVHLDIHYMDNYKVFTVDKNRFPDLPALAEELKSKGIRLITIVDPGVKVEKGYDVYDEGIKLGYFCKKTEEQGEFIGAVWPGPSVFPDFFRKDVREWWSKKYLRLLDLGIAAFWNDMNEPAMFYTPEALERYSDALNKHRVEKQYNDDLANLIFSNGLQNNEDYNDQFVHEIDGRKVKHRAVRNLYGTMMTNSLADYFDEHSPDKRQFLLSRSSYPGMHRRAAIWTGDNHAWWEHLSLNIQMLISLNMSGMLFTGADIGGFSGDCNGELLIRWNQLGLFMPFYRNHSAAWSIRQEPWCFGKEALELTRKSIKLRYALLPYIYGEFVYAALNARPFISGLFFNHKEAWERINDNQFYAGRALVVSPIIEASSMARNVWLPEGTWLKVKTCEDGLIGEKVIEGGDHRIDAGLGETPLFMKVNSMVPMSEPLMHTNFAPPVKYKILAYVEDIAECVILLDDGEKKYSDWKSYPKVYCRLENKEGNQHFSLQYESTEPQSLSFTVEVWTKEGQKRFINT